MVPDHRPLRAYASPSSLLLVVLTFGAAAVGFSPPALAGPNFGGTLVVHDTGLAYTSDVAIYPTLAPDSCAVVDAEAPVGFPADGQGWVWKAYAAFPSGSAPRLKALAFGATWSGAEIRVLSGGVPNPSQDFEIPQVGWPEQPGGVVGVSFLVTKTALISEVYWFAGYAYGPAIWSLAPHPVQVSEFVDDGFPPQEDMIAGFSTLGFGQPGNPVCPGIPGACCFESGDCQVLGQEACLAAGGIEWGPLVDCDPYPCTLVPGACCFATGECQLLNGFECLAAGGVFQGQATACVPNPCPAPTGACCYGSGYCDVRSELSCLHAGGVWMGAETDCSPKPCPQPPIGACCLPTGQCVLVSQSLCGQYGGDYLGDGTLCEPVNPCPQPPPQAACCFSNGLCLMRTEEQCAQQGGNYQGDATDCSPNPCPQPMGACCLADGSCVVEASGSCSALGGIWLGVGTPCEPNPCAQLAGACCFPDGSCLVLSWPDCNGEFIPFEPCDPNPCSMFLGACCFYDGACLVMEEAECYASSGWYWLQGEPCEPNPCDNSTPVQKTTWGRIKRSYY